MVVQLIFLFLYLPFLSLSLFFFVSSPSVLVLPIRQHMRVSVSLIFFYALYVMILGTEKLFFFSPSLPSFFYFYITRPFNVKNIEGY